MNITKLFDERNILKLVEMDSFISPKAMAAGSMEGSLGIELSPCSSLLACWSPSSRISMYKDSEFIWSKQVSVTKLLWFMDSSLFLLIYNQSKDQKYNIALIDPKDGSTLKDMEIASDGEPSGCYWLDDSHEKVAIVWRNALVHILSIVQQEKTFQTISILSLQHIFREISCVLPSYREVYIFGADITSGTLIKKKFKYQKDFPFFTSNLNSPKKHSTGFLSWIFQRNTKSVGQSPNRELPIKAKGFALGFLSLNSQGSIVYYSSTVHARYIFNIECRGRNSKVVKILRKV